MNHVYSYSAVGLALLLAACATTPTGPSAMALPGTGKSFDQFRYDDNSCRLYARDQIGGTSANQAANDSLARSAALGTGVGAAAGALAGGGRGAGVGAAAGLIVGTAAGTGAAESSSYNAQQRYDYAYVQCMYAKGHRVPVSGRMMSESRRYSPPPPPNRPLPPPPPPGSPPPPPPGY